MDTSNTGGCALRLSKLLVEEGENPIDGNRPDTFFVCNGTREKIEK